MTTHRLTRYLCRAWGTSPGQGQQGLTLIECLVAIIVVGLIGSAIAPALVISVATRVQSQKAEQALELAQSEIDRVRLLVERNEANITTLPFSAPFTASYTEDNEVALVAGPQAGVPLARPNAPNAPPYTDFDETFRANLGGNDFAVQVYRTEGRLVGSVPVTFSMGVRVYDIEAVESGSGTMPSEPASLGMVGGQGDRLSRPLVALYTNVSAGETGTSLCSFIRHLDRTGTPSVPIGCN